MKMIKVSLVLLVCLMSVGCSRLPADWKTSTQQPNQQQPGKELKLEDRIIAASQKMNAVPVAATTEPSPVASESPEPTPINFYPPTQEEQKLVQTKTVWRAANIRSTPSYADNSNIIEVIAANTQVQTTSYPDNGWVRVATPSGKAGFIHTSNIQW